MTTITREPVAAPPSRPTRWQHDLALGVRLAAGGSRTSWVRLVLGTIGVGLAAAVLLVGASIGHILDSQSARAAGMMVRSEPIPGVAPLRYVFGDTRFRDEDINGRYVRATGPNSPVPPGLSSVPGPHEIVVSPALAALLASPDGALLRPRFPQRIVGEIGQNGLQGPQDLTFYAGIPPGESDTAGPSDLVYGFGHTGNGDTLNNPAVLALLLTGIVALLVPILIMVTVSSRIAGAARDRRLAALRLVGAGSRQVRRIAAAEALVPAGTGLVLGVGLFVLFRLLAPKVRLLGVSVFTSDVSVSWPLVVLIVLAVPMLSVGSSMVALRRTVIEPLGVVRGGKPVRRRLWWRLALVALGVAILVGTARTQSGGRFWIVLVVLGVSALLLGMPALLPFLLERGVSVLRGGPPSWQLAIRRLQLDSGTPARVVGGVAVVLAGAIALQTIVAATSIRLSVADAGLRTADPNLYFVITDTAIVPPQVTALRRTGATDFIGDSTVVYLSRPADLHDPTDAHLVTVASCATIRHTQGPIPCHDGDVFVPNGFGPLGRPGATLDVVSPSPDGTGPSTVRGHWTLPKSVIPLKLSTFLGPAGALLVTPGAFRGAVLPPDAESWLLVHVRPDRADGIEYVRDAVANHPLRTSVSGVVPQVSLDQDQRAFQQVRTGLLIGSLFTLGLAGVSLLVLALEQVRERRRPLAMLSASGVSRAVLVRSLLWQVAVPVAVGVVAAIGTGLALATLILRVTHTDVVLDWGDVVVFSGAAAGLVLLVTAATLPALRNATRLAALRTE
jgi:hypothetical protein